MALEASSYWMLSPRVDPPDSLTNDVMAMPGYRSPRPIGRSCRLPDERIALPRSLATKGDLGVGKASGVGMAAWLAKTPAFLWGWNALSLLGLSLCILLRKESTCLRYSSSLAESMLLPSYSPVEFLRSPSSQMLFISSSRRFSFFSRRLDAFFLFFSYSICSSISWYYSQLYLVVSWYALRRGEWAHCGLALPISSSRAVAFICFAGLRRALASETFFALTFAPRQPFDDLPPSTSGSFSSRSSLFRTGLYRFGATSQVVSQRLSVPVSVDYCAVVKAEVNGLFRPYPRLNCSAANMGVPASFASEDC